MTASAQHTSDNRSQLRVVARESGGQPRTYRLTSSRSHAAAYRRLATTILGLDVATLADELRHARQSALARLPAAS